MIATIGARTDFPDMVENKIDELLALQSEGRFLVSRERIQRQAISKLCSDQANTKGLHGMERKKF
ncbi:MAG: hypothetical protein EPO23_12415 [Xanthobacteraceae bacterium]|nr:MAG: hypothetical protein EPO23_12415 [Xanthobacteraceae bacterium]